MQLNKVILAGNITRDIETKFLPSQTAVAEFGLAINRKFKKQDGSQGEEVCFVDCQAFAKTAETIAKFFKKGDPIFIEGRLKYESWEKDGKKQSKIRVMVENWQFAGGKKDSQPDDTGNDDIAF